MSKPFRRHPALSFFLVLLFAGIYLPVPATENVYIKGAVYQDFMGLSSGPDSSYYRLSTRLKWTLLNRPGDGLSLSFDIRDRYKLGAASANQLIIYDVKVEYDTPDSRFFLAAGQMNLYDTAGIGELAGGLAGIKLGNYLSAGGYIGLEPDIYNSRWDGKYRKHGLFLRYLGSMARQWAVGYHSLSYGGESERRFLYGTFLWPVKNLAVFYGAVEYELSQIIHSEDRFSHLFFNGRLNLSRYLDITGHYSSGRGLDYHRFLLENSQHPGILNDKIERFYYNRSFGLRLSLKPGKNWRIYLSQRESENKDTGIRNHTTQMGASVTNIIHTGISLFGYYNLNQGEASESDSFSIRCSRSFGKLSLNIGYANFYSQVQTGPEGEPEIVYQTDQYTLLADIFYIINRTLAVSAEYAVTFDGEITSNLCCVRLIFRKSSR